MFVYRLLFVCLALSFPALAQQPLQTLLAGVEQKKQAFELFKVAYKEHSLAKPD